MKVSIDSRTVEPGDVFIPIKGPNFDGRDFIADAQKKGARILDVDLTDFAKRYRKKLNAKVIGITGSAGKTTAKDMLTAVLGQKFKVVSTKGNQNNEIGVPLTILSADHDTDILIVEMGIRNPGDMPHLAKIVCPTHVVITSIGYTHLELFKTQSAIARAKSEIMRAPLSWQTDKRIAFLNYKTPYYKVLEKRAEKKQFKVLPFKGETPIDQAMDMCFQIGYHFGLSTDEIQKGLQHFKTSDHRLKVHKLPTFTLIDDSYNANPDGVRYALSFMSRFKGRKLVVIGDMLELGPITEKAHRQLAVDFLETGVDVVFAYGECCRHIQDKKLDITYFSDQKMLYKALKQELKSGDVVLVKGSRGMALDKIVDQVLKDHGDTQYAN